MTFVFSHSFVLLFLNFIIFYGEENKVEAKKKEVIPVPGWFNEVEGFVLPNIKKSTEPSYIGRHVETDEMLSNLNKKHRKKKGKKKSAKKFVAEHRRKSNNLNKKKKHRLGGSRLKFLKTDINDAKDSKLSNSQENHAQRKPVDIIVHIKMNE